MPEFVDAVVKATGRKQRIPAHWLDHPTLGAPFRLTARERRRREQAEAAPQPQPEAEQVENPPVE